MRADVKGRYGDGGELYLDVAEGGTKSWLFKRPQSNGIVERTARCSTSTSAPRAAAPSVHPEGELVMLIVSFAGHGLH